MTLRVAPDGWAFPKFEPGQYVSLGLSGSARRSMLSKPESVAPEPQKLIRRAYSIASSPQNREFLEFYLNLVPAGVLTPRLFAVTSGDRIWLGSKVAGSFTLKSVPEDSNLVLIATGTGLAPYVSMLMSPLKSATHGRIVLIHGVRQSRDLGYRSFFTALQDRTNFAYLPIVSRPQLEVSSWAGAAGHVQDLWNSNALERACGFRPSPESTHVCLCGNPEMIESMISILVRRGFQEQTPKQPGQIHSERYWPIKPKRTTDPGLLAA
jgi:ferredoxin--NADP+ reductase